MESETENHSKTLEVIFGLRWQYTFAGAQGKKERGCRSPSDSVGPRLGFVARPREFLGPFLSRKVIV